MKQYFISFLFFLFLISSCASTKNTNSVKDIESHNLTFQNKERKYYTYIPKGIVPNSKTPILFVLHGGGGTAKKMPRFTKYGFNELAEKDNFIVVYPQGVGKQWNDGRSYKTYPTISDDEAWKDNVDDIGFFLEIINQLKKQFSINENKIFTCGISNGGFMSNRLICERPDVFKGAGIVTATSEVDYFKTCNPSKNIGVIIINGTKDKIVPYNGGDLIVLNKKRAKVVSTEDYAAFWAKANNCGTKGTWKNLPDSKKDKTTVSKLTYSNCNNNSNVVLYKVEGGGHTWPGTKNRLYELIAGKATMDINACNEIWSFFKTLNN